MRYEVKIGILALVAIALAFWGYKYIQGSNLLSRAGNFHALYEDVSGLTAGTPVTISGVTVGSVQNIQLDQATRMVRVDFEVNRDINIPPSTVATITTVSIMGEKSLSLSYAKPCFGDGDCAPEGAELEGKVASLLSSFTGGDPDADPLDDAKGQLKSTLDTLEYKFFDPNSDNPVARASNDLAVVMEQLKVSTARLQGIMDQNAREINTTMDNFASLSTTLAGKQEAIAQTLDNASEFSGDLSKLELDKTMTEVNQAVANLKTTLGKADKGINGLNQIMTKVNSGQGTLGKLLQDDQIYDRIDRASGSLDTLVTDLQERPYRYIPFKSRKRVLKLDRKDRELEASGGRDVKAVVVDKEAS